MHLCSCPLSVGFSLFHACFLLLPTFTLGAFPLVLPSSSRAVHVSLFLCYFLLVFVSLFLLLFGSPTHFFLLLTPPVCVRECIALGCPSPLWPASRPRFFPVIFLCPMPFSPTPSSPFLSSSCSSPGRTTSSLPRVLPPR